MSESYQNGQAGPSHYGHRGVVLNAGPRPKGVIYDESFQDQEHTDEDQLLLKSNRRRRYMLDEDDDDVVKIEDHNLISNAQSLMYLFKANTGVAILAIPCAFKYGGIMASPIVMFIIACFAMISFNMLSTSNTYLTAFVGVKLDYGEMAFFACENGPYVLLRKYPHFVKFFANSMLVFAQLGNCIAYFIFLAGTLRTVFVEYDLHGLLLNMKVLTLIVFGPLFLFAMIRNIRLLSKLAGFINLFYLFSLVSIMVCMVMHISNPEGLPKVGTMQTVPIFFGDAIYTIEGIGCLIPLKNKTRNQDAWTYILNFGMSLVFGMIIIFGFLGYAAFGEETNQSITYNLPPTIFYKSVHFLLSVTVLVSYPVQLYPVVHMTKQQVKKILPKQSDKVHDYTARTFLVFVTLVAAVAIPGLSLLLDLVGSIASVALALLLPALIYDCVVFMQVKCWTGYRMMVRALAYLILLLGLIGGLVSSGIAIKDIVAQWR